MGESERSEAFGTSGETGMSSGDAAELEELRRLLDFNSSGTLLPKPDVVGNRIVEQQRLLRDDGDRLPQGSQ